MVLPQLPRQSLFYSLQSKFKVINSLTKLRIDLHFGTSYCARTEVLGSQQVSTWGGRGRTRIHVTAVFPCSKAQKAGLAAWAGRLPPGPGKSAHVFGLCVESWIPEIIFPLSHQLFKKLHFNKIKLSSWNYCLRHVTEKQRSEEMERMSFIILCLQLLFFVLAM